MNAPLPGRAHLRLVENQLSEREVCEPLPLRELISATFDAPCPIYPLEAWRRAFRR
jgi:hypothetical protein